VTPVVAVVDDGRDSLAAHVARLLAARGREVVHVPAAELARARLELSSSGARLNGRPLAAVLFRARLPGWFADGFEAEDAQFCHGETAAAWMAVLDHEPILAINRLDPQLWFTHVEWPAWWKRLEAAGLPVAPVDVGEVEGGRWLPWTGGVAQPPGPGAARCFAAATTTRQPERVSVWLRGRHVAGDRSASAQAASCVLADHGAAFAQVAVGADDSIVTCTAHPTVAPDRAAAAITEELDAHLRRR